MLSRRHFAAAGVAIAIALAPASAADEALAPYTGLAVRGRALLRSGQVAEADRLVRAGLEFGADDTLLCLTGEIRFRRADFDGARRALQSAADANPANARAWWGLGRIQQLHFNRTAARDLFAKAYRLDPSDTDIILSYLDFVDNSGNRQILLRNLAALSRESMPDRAAQAMARLQVESHLAGRPAGALSSAYTTYRLPLAAFHPTDATRHGLIVNARINGSRPLRLVLDTGARGILLHKSVVGGLGLERVVESQVSGFGGNASSDSTLTLAHSVAFDDLSFRDCLVEVSTHDVTPGADGILGASLFERFRVRIDAQSRTLDLTPEETEGPHDIQALGLNRLLLVRANVPGGREGLFLLDTGAAFTAITPNLASAAQARVGGVGLAGVQGVAGAFRVAPIALQVGGRALAEPAPVAFDLAAMSQREGVEISGILGFSTLSRWPVTIDFRSGLVRIGDAR